MKKLKNVGYCALLACFSSIVVSCDKEEPAAQQPVETEKEVVLASTIDTKSLRPEAVKYYSNIKTAILATNSNSPEEQANAENNPLVKKLQNFEFIKDDATKCSFYDMPEAEQEKFLNDWALIQADQMSKRIDDNTELLDFVQQENEIIGSVLSDEITMSRSGEAKIKDNNAFFAKIQERYIQKNEEDSKAGVQSSLLKPKGMPIPFDRFMPSVAASAKRGDIMVTLPQHGQPYIFYDAFKDKFKVGHAAVVVKQPTADMTGDSSFTFGARTCGVNDEPAEYWSVQSYILGLQNVKWHWSFRKGFYKEVTPISNMSALADAMLKFRGYEYVKWYEFATAKWVAPKRFTCTTLVWWCTKQVYNIDLSSWLSPLVTPGEIVTSDHTYVKKIVD